MNKTIATILLGGTLVTANTIAIKYRSIQVSDEAKIRVVAISKELKLSQRDTASKMILEWKPKLIPECSLTSGRPCILLEDTTPPIPPVATSTLITWDSSKINSDKVKITIVKRTSTDPNTYELVKVLEDDTENDGRFGWTFKNSDYEGDTYLDIGCGSTPPEGCQSLPIREL